MAKFIRSSKDRIVFSDGRKGFQVVNHYDDGSTDLVEVVVTRRSDGSGCRDVYAQQCDLMARVYSLGNLAPATWEISSVIPS